MRILQISSAESLGGGERSLADLANALTARGHNVYAAVRPNSPLIPELTLPNANVRTLPLRNALDARSARELASFVRRKGIEIVHAHMARDYPLAAYAARRNRDARLVVTRHVLFPLNRLHRLTLSEVATVIAVSQAVGRQLRSEKLIPPEKITVVLNGIDIARFETAISKFDRERFLRAWGLPPKSLLVGSVGELTPLKGHEDFLRAAARIMSLFPNAFFIIAGMDNSKTQENRANLESLIQELKIADCVRLIGWMDDIASLFCALDVFVSASRTEAFGLAIAEAMAVGTAVVATETAGAQEIIQHGKIGLLVPVGDVAALAESINDLLKDEERRGRIGSRAREVVRSLFSLDLMVEAIERIYRKSLSGDKQEL